MTMAARMNKYEPQEKLGEGTYGVVYKARNTATNEIVAIKQIHLDDEDEGVPGTAIREVAVLKDSEHPFIVKLHEVCYVNQRLWLVFEYIEHDLHKYIQKLRAQSLKLDRMVIKSFLYQLVRGIHFCHSRRTLHRDLKPGNILIDNAGNLKIADFGLARTFGVPLRAYSHNVVTLWYRPPEILLGLDRYSTPVDIWSIGCIFAEMALLKPIFQGDSEIDQLYKIFEIMGTPVEEDWEGVSTLPDYNYPAFPKFNPKPLDQVVPLERDGIDLLTKMLHMDPSKRISARDAIQHPYFHEVRAR